MFKQISLLYSMEIIEKKFIELLDKYNVLFMYISAKDLIALKKLGYKTLSAVYKDETIHQYIVTKDYFYLCFKDKKIRMKLIEKELTKPIVKVPDISADDFKEVLKKLNFKTKDKVIYTNGKHTVEIQHEYWHKHFTYDEYLTVKYKKI